MKYCSVLICVFSLFLATSSQAEVWLCKRGDLEEYTNVGNTKNCRKLNLPGITTVPAAKVSPAAVRSSGAAAQVRPAEFPKVDGNVQRARDDDRRKLLEDELKEQESKLLELRKSANAGQPEQQLQIGRTEANIASLKRELSRINN
jgi:ribosomal protein L29